MGLADCPVSAAVAVSDMARATAFYEGVLGLVRATDHEPEDNVAYVCGGGTLMHVFLSPFAGTAKSTTAGFGVPDIEAAVDELTAAGVVFDRWFDDTDDKGITTFAGVNKVAYFKDPDGNILSLGQV